MRDVLQELSNMKFVIIEVIIGLIFVAMITIVYSYFKNKLTRITKENVGKKKVLEAINSSGEFMAVIGARELNTLYASDNSMDLFGIDTKQIYRNIDALFQVTDAKTVRIIKNSIEKWDGEYGFELEFPFLNQANGFGKLFIGRLKNGEEYLIVIRNITGEINARKELEKNLELEKVANKSKTEFLSKMSHEIRTPMNGILGLFTLAKMDMDNKNAVVDYIDKAEGLAQFLLSLINDVLDMSRIENGKVELEKRKIDLVSMADKIHTMFQKTIEDKGITYVVKFEDFNIRYVIGDELRLTQIIINFISNAQKFTDAGGLIEVSFRQMEIIGENAHIMLRVRDTGKGMDKDFLTRIFKPFEQENVDITRQYGGSGLGMAIADQMITLMDGQIVVNSEIGKGTDFSVYLTLPIAEQEQEIDISEIEDVSNINGVQKQQYDVSGKNILLAEDNDINAEIAIEMLKRMGASVTRAIDGKQACSIFEQSEIKEYDLIFMDIQMPEINGWEATKIIRNMERKDAQEIYIIAMSANAFVEDKRYSIECGMNGHISKPIDFPSLNKLITDIVN